MFIFYHQLAFLITTDDLTWARKEFTDQSGEKFYFVADFYTADMGVKERHLDMCTMSLCDHSIFDYGSYGFWGAYLAGGYTVLAQNMGSGANTEVENIKPAKLEHWTFIEAFLQNSTVTKSV